MKEFTYRDAIASKHLFEMDSRDLMNFMHQVRPHRYTVQPLHGGNGNSRTTSKGMNEVVTISKNSKGQKISTTTYVSRKDNNGK